MDPIYMAGPNVTEADAEIVLDMLRTGWYGEGAYSYVEKFEKEFASYHNRTFGLMTPNCTSAIHLLLQGLEIGAGDEVIVPDSTWIASAAPIHYVGAIPIFADVDENSWTLSVESISSRVTPRTKAVIVVDLYGNMPDYSEIIKYCSEKKLILIEDAAEAVGSQYKDKRAGSFGVGSVFSFHRTKTITTGEGGMLLLDDPELYNRCKFLRDHGRQPGSYYNTEITFKYMPSNMMGALGYAQFLRVEELIAKKRKILKNYSAMLKSASHIRLNLEQDYVVNGAWSTVSIFSDDLDLSATEAIQYFNQKNLPTRPFFLPLSQLPAFKEYSPIGKYDNTIANKLFLKGICLPSALNITIEQQEKVVETLLELIISRS